MAKVVIQTGGSMEFHPVDSSELEDTASTLAFKEALRKERERTKRLRKRRRTLFTSFIVVIVAVILLLNYYGLEDNEDVSEVAVVLDSPVMNEENDNVVLQNEMRANPQSEFVPEEISYKEQFVYPEAYHNKLVELKGYATTRSATRVGKTYVDTYILDDFGRELRLVGAEGNEIVNDQLYLAKGTFKNWNTGLGIDVKTIKTAEREQIEKVKELENIIPELDPETYENTSETWSAIYWLRQKACSITDLITTKYNDIKEVAPQKVEDAKAKAELELEKAEAKAEWEEKKRKEKEVKINEELTRRQSTSQDSSDGSGMNTNLIEAEILRLVNEERSRNKVFSLRASSHLDDFSKRWSNKMLTGNFLEHSNLGFPYSSQAAENIAYTPIHYSVIGCGSTYGEENMADCFVSGWIESSGHHTNMINSRYSSTGIGVACDYSECKATQVFAG